MTNARRNEIAHRILQELLAHIHSTDTIWEALVLLVAHRPDVHGMINSYLSAHGPISNGESEIFKKILADAALQLPRGQAAFG